MSYQPVQQETLCTSCAKAKINLFMPGLQAAVWHVHKVTRVNKTMHRKILCKLIEIVPISFSILSLSRWHSQWLNPRDHLLGKANPAKSMANNFCFLFFLPVWLLIEGKPNNVSAFLHSLYNLIYWDLFSVTRSFAWKQHC